MKLSFFIYVSVNVVTVSSFYPQQFWKVEPSVQYAVLKRVLDRLQLSDIGLGKRASDPLDHSGFGFSKRSFDRVDSSGFGLGKRTFNGRKDKSCFSFAKKMAIIRMPKITY